MPTEIKIKINYINDLLLFSSPNDTVIINKIITDNGIIFKEIVNINYQIIESLSKKSYYIQTNYYDFYSELLIKYNFSIRFNSKKKILYDYVYKNKEDQTIYVYYENIDIPFNMIGLINDSNSLTVLFECELTINDSTAIPFKTVVSLRNENLKNDNFITLPGNIISIDSIEITDVENLMINYNLFETIEPVIISDLARIYFYNPIFIRIINIPIGIHNKLSIDVINVLVQLIDGSGLIVYSYITNLNLDLVKSEEKTSYVLSFKNNVDISNHDYESIVLRVFDYDFEIYFSSLSSSSPNDFINCEPITINEADLYWIIIEPNSNIPEPTILNLDITKYITLINIENYDNIFYINKNLANKIVEQLLYSGNERFNIILDYLINFKIKDYNLYNITFIPSIKSNLNSKNIISESVDNQFKLKSINPENLMLNSNLVNIEIFFNDKQSNIQNYNIYGMLFNNNNTWDIYTKKYLFDDKKNKYDMIKDLMIMSINYLQIVIYIYSDLDDLLNSKVSKIGDSGIIYINNYWRFNRIILNKTNSKMIFSLDENYYLKMYFKINVDYKMFTFYSDTQIPNFNSSPNSNVLNFKTDAFYSFKIFLINQPNGSTKSDKYVYSILFQNIEECNDFMYFIQYGIAVRPELSTSSYWNITNSKYFQLDSSGYYILTNSVKNSINFSILDVDLYSSNVFVNNQIIYYP